jgi:tetratricopeptide (TPR) repeat protein
MLICNHCGNIIEDELRFCTECGGAIPVSQTTLPPMPANTGGLGVPAFSHQTQVAPLVQTTIDSTAFTEVGASGKKTGLQNGTKILLGSISAVAVIAIALAIYFAIESSPTAKLARAMESAMSNGKLVTLSHDDAYSYFFQLRGQDPTHKALKEVAPKVMPQLRSIGDEVIRKRMSVQTEEILEPEWRKILRVYEWAHILEPNDKSLEAKWKFAEGAVAESQGRTKDAENSYRTATQADKSWALPHNRLGLLYVEQKDFYKAVDSFLQAIALQPKWEFPYNNMGTAYFNLKDYDTAAGYYRKAIEINPNWARPHYWLGEVCEKKGWKTEALSEYEAVRNLDSGFKTAVIQEKVRRLQ